MNVAGYLVSLTALAVLWRISTDWLGAYRRRLDLMEQEIAQPQEPQPLSIVLEDEIADTEMPPVLKQRIEAWEDDWAKEDQRRAIMELKRKYRTWDKVMAAMDSAA